MKRAHLLIGGFALLAMAPASAQIPATNTPPHPMTEPEMTKPEPVTPAPPQSHTKSAKGAAAPNGANGVTLSGRAVTKMPNTPSKQVKNPAAAPAPAAAAAAAPPLPASAPAVAVTKPKPSVLDEFLNTLSDQLKLSGDEKKDIQTYYLADGAQLNTILNDASQSPLQQAQQVSDLRNERNGKIDALLQDVDREQKFHEIEAKYRIALTESAAEGGLLPAQPPAPAPSPSKTAPGNANPPGARPFGSSSSSSSS